MMQTRIEFEQTVVRPLIAAGCLYEFTAILSRRMPTISALLDSLHRRSWGRPVLWLILGWFAVHICDTIVQDMVDASGETMLDNEATNC